MTDYLLRIRFDPSDTVLEELVQARLFLTASGGNVSDEQGVVAWFDDEASRKEAFASFGEVAGVELALLEKEREDWLRNYQQSLVAMEIGERFIVAPEASLIAPSSGRLSLVIPQEQAFGTGSHETTSLCLEMLESVELRAKRGLDVGAGSGILALAMLRLGAERAIAFDNDVDAYAALRENRARNGVDSASMPLFVGGYESLRGGDFDVITMNIVPEVIVPALPELRSRFAVAARVVLSGVLSVRSAEVTAAAEAAGLRSLAQREKGEWWCGLFGTGV